MISDQRICNHEWTRMNTNSVCHSLRDLLRGVSATRGWFLVTLGSWIRKPVSGHSKFSFVSIRVHSWFASLPGVNAND